MLGWGSRRVPPGWAQPEPRFLPPCGAAVPDLIPAPAAGAERCGAASEPANPAHGGEPGTGCGSLRCFTRGKGRKAKPIPACPFWKPGAARDEDTGVRSRLSSQEGNVPGPDRIPGVRQHSRKGLCPRHSAPNSPGSPLLPPGLTPPWPPASAALPGARRFHWMPSVNQITSAARAAPHLAFIRRGRGSMGAGLGGCQHRNSPVADGARVPLPGTRGQPAMGEGHCPVPEPGELRGAARVGHRGRSLAAWIRPCRTHGSVPVGALLATCPLPFHLSQHPDLMGLCGTSQCPSGEDGSGMGPGGTRAPVRDVGTHAHARVWLGQRRRLPGDLDPPPDRDPAKGAGWGLPFTYGSSASSSSGLMPDPGVQLMLWDFSARALPHQPAGVGDLGDHPPFLPCGPGEPPRRRSGLRGSTCGRGDRVAATLGGLRGRGPGQEKGWRHRGLGTRGRGGLGTRTGR